MKRMLSIFGLATLLLGSAWAYGADAIISVDRSLEIMEKTAAPETVADFEKTHSAPFWLFGEDRQLSVRVNRVPAHWFAPASTEDDIRDFNRQGAFSGTAQPGEYYVFQTVILSPKADTYSFTGSFTLKDATSSQPISAQFISHSPVSVSENGCQPVWLGFNIPANATGKTITGTVNVSNSAEQTVQLNVNIPVEGEFVVDNGIHDSWRLARLEWLDSTVGASEEIVPAPFTAVELNEKTRTLKIIGRSLELNELGLPKQYWSFYSASNTHILPNGKPFWNVAPVLSVVVNGKTLVWDSTAKTISSLKFTHRTPCKVCWTSQSQVDNIVLTVDASLECDGAMILNMNLTTADGQKVEADSVSYDFAVEEKSAPLFMGLGKKGGNFPDAFNWKWNQWHQDTFWLGTINQGIQIRMKDNKYVRPLINCYYKFRPLTHPETWGTGGVTVKKENELAIFSLYAGKTELSNQAKDFRLDMYFTPFKPVNLARHLNDRYYHRNRSGIGNPPEAGIDQVKSEGANNIILHQSTVQNPYINYPFNDDSIGLLRHAVKAAHERDMRLKVYYTTRELTQNLPEFFALRSLGNEIFMPLKKDVGWPVTNPKGPHQWLTQHVGDDVIPAWHENCKFKEYPPRLDLSIITTPDSRWNNFFLAGLEYMIKDIGIDGIYIDDTALDRISMQRARRILDADGNTGRRIDNHSWSHFQGLAGNISSALCYSEIYPYVDSLWYGESFNYNTPAEYWITEMSGLPYGLMSQMLQGGGNQWRGMCFAMTRRHGWSGNMTPLWQFFTDSQITESEFIGFWDDANPATCSNENVKVTAYVFKDKIILAAANFTNSDQDAVITVKNAQYFSNSIEVPAITQFQSAQTVQGEKKADGTLQFNLKCEAGKGFLLIVK